jgi:putative phosphoesterase
MARRRDTARIGVISDTHGLLRPEALRALRGVDLIVHAGDVGTPEVLKALRAIAPVVAVRGNNDRGAWARTLRETETIDVAGARLHVVHDVKELDLDPRARGVRVVIAGHSHRPSVVDRDGVLFLNPGSAGPRRFTLPISVATLVVSSGRARARIVELKIALPARSATPRR